ncbi:Vetispiradiene synthase [Handroanthus impetiginosus]|uniref:Vetispiradiene synthase n=1 Tax=Handroanthus impetiginosus TaxID=429701 RepID=A0A2G9GUB6_9LAMI|nr:Vetispiradiene synthase [Handroanthus impetiginosus]
MKNSENSQQEIIRRVANFSPSLWGDLFINSSSIDTQVPECYGNEIEELKEKVGKMIVASEKKLEEKLVLIDIVERLGLSYHFKNEIQAQLELIFNGSFKLENEEKDLFITALEFRLLRQHGFDASSCVFKKFIENNGKFEENLRGDIKGLLSLYEAAHLKYHGETILEEALIFSTTILETIVNKQELSIALIVRQAKHALEQPLQRSIERLEARYFIDFYEENELKDESLLRLAKLDFNQLQMLHRKEVYEVSRWWKDLDFISKLSYARDRVVECYFWSLGMYFEPQYSRARVMLAKVIAMISIIDDTYDSYGTIDELEIFTQAIEREHGRSFAVHYAKATMKELARGYNTEAKWFTEGHVPSFADYMANGCITSTYNVLTTASYLGMNSATKEAFDWVMKQHRLQVAAAILGRIMNDTARSVTITTCYLIRGLNCKSLLPNEEFEKIRGQPATGIECYMNEYGVSEEEALKELSNIAENAWKNINEEFVKKDGISMEIIKTVVDLARVTYVVYKHNQDKYTHPEKVLKPHIIRLLVDYFKI